MTSPRDQAGRDVRVLDLGDLAAAGEPTGAVAVVDVLRACTTAAAALAAGAREVHVAATVTEAFATAERLGGAPIAGEVGGFPVDGFTFTNSPVAVAGADLAGRPMVLRTTAGTQGLLAARGAGLVLAAGFVTAAATAAALRQATGPATVVVTGCHSADRGAEDRALAGYLQALLGGREPDPAPYLAAARASAAARRFRPGGDLEAYAADLEACLDLDRYRFAVVLDSGRGFARLRRA